MSAADAASPRPPFLGVGALFRRAYRGEDLGPLASALSERALHDDDDAEAMLDLSVVLLLGGQRDLSNATQDMAFAVRRLFTLPAARPPAGLRVLVIKGPGDLLMNTPIEFMLEDSDVTLHLLYLRPGEVLPAALPPHDLVFVAPAESDDHQPLLAYLSDALRDWPRPVVNRPEAIARLTRDGVCALLGKMPGLYAPKAVRVPRADLEALADGRQAMERLLPDGFPVIVRPFGSQAGHELERLDGAEDVREYLGKTPAEIFYLAPFVDYRSSDGQFRKYRVALIEARAYLCHLAISSHWKVHYLNAGMRESAAKRAEEAACMASFDETFVRRHAAALAAIKQTLELDYLALDCAETRDGKLLIFEADTAMVVHAVDPVDVFPYKQPQMEKVFGAFRRLLDHAAGRTQA